MMRNKRISAAFTIMKKSKDKTRYKHVFLVKNASRIVGVRSSWATGNGFQKKCKLKHNGILTILLGFLALLIDF